MNIKIEIECNTINDLHSQLTKLASQVKKSAKKQKLNLLTDEFEAEDSDSLSDDNCYGNCDVVIELPKEIQEANKYIISCESDMGFMGSPTYDENKKLVENYYSSKSKKV